MHRRPVYHQSFEPFEYLIAEGSKAKLNIRPSPTLSLFSFTSQNVAWCLLIFNHTYGTARFKLYKHSRVPYTRHYTSQKIFVACLQALGKVMTSPPLVASKHTCYKLVTSFSTRAHNVNALDTCHTRNQLERVFVCIYTCIYLITC